MVLAGLVGRVGPSSLHTPMRSFIFRFTVVVTLTPFLELSIPAHSNMGAAKLGLSLLLLGLLRGPG